MSNSTDIFQEIKDKLTKKFQMKLDNLNKIGLIMPEVKEKIITELKTLKSNILDKDIEDFSVSKIVRTLSKKIDPDVILQINLESFLSVIRHIVKFKKTKKFKKEITSNFSEYIDSLDEKLINSYLDLGEDAFDNKKSKKSAISKKKYEKIKTELQVELLKLQEWVIKNKKKVCIVFEGRDAAGKGSTIKRFVERMMPKGQRLVALGIPTEDESKNWFPRYEKQLPKAGEIVFFDRSWYNRAVVEPTMKYCSKKQYVSFMEKVPQWEEDLINDGVILIKFWLSIKPEIQLGRFEARQESALKYWKFSKNDLAAQSMWDVMTKYKDQMFEKTSTDISPWVMVNSNDKLLARLNMMRYVLDSIDYKGKSKTTRLKPSQEILTLI